MTFNVDGLEKQCKIVKEVLKRSDPDIMLLQETKANQTFQHEIANEYKKYRFTLNATDEYEDTTADRVMATNKALQAGTGALVSERLGDCPQFKPSPTHRFHEISLPGLCIINVYMPADGAGLAKQEDFRQVLADISEYLEENAGSREIIVLGDFNCSKRQQRKSRWRSLEELMDRHNLRATVPDFTTNYNPNYAETTIDLMVSSGGVKVKTITSLDKEVLPGNTSTHIPVVFEVEYDNNVPPTPAARGDLSDGGENGDSKTDDTDELYMKRKRPNWAKKVDMALYRKLEKIYSTISFKLTEGLPSPWRLKLLEDMLSHASTLAEIRTGRKQLEEEHSKQMRGLMKVLKTWERRLKSKVIKLAGPDWILVPVRGLMEMCPTLQRGLEPILEKISRLSQQIRTQQRKEWDEKNERRNEAMTEALRDNDLRKFFDANKISSSDPNTSSQQIIYEGVTYTGKEILTAYVKHAKAQSENPRTVPGNPVDWKYVTRRDIYLMRRFTAEQDTRQLEHLNEETYMKLLSSLKKNKASDLYNCTLEHLVYASQETAGYMVEMINDILDSPSLYAHTSISRSKASMLYKGKNKNKTEVGSYRRIQICSLSQKLIQKIISKPAGEQTKKSMVSTQWGFTPKVSFLQATFVRETLTKLAVDLKTNIYLIASDVESAFSRTERALQLYELSKQGESGKILLFSDAFYKNTDVIMSSGSDFSALFQESRGAAQGSLLAPPHWKSYSVPLHSKLTTSGLGIRLAEEDWSCLSVADDTITVTDSREKFGQIDKIYQEYETEYGVKFSFDKTHINIFGPGSVEHLKEGLEFGGCKLKVSEESDHLGLKVLQNPKKTESRNTENRIAKANKKLFQVMGRSFRRRYPMTKKVSKTLLQSVISPMLTSGLQALCMGVTELKRLQKTQNTTLRRTYGVGKISPNSPLLLMLGLLPIEGQVHHQSLALFNNVWSLPGPARKLLEYLFDNKTLRQYHWSCYLRDICSMYSIPDPGEIIRMTHIRKERWNAMLKPRIIDVQEKKLQTKINRAGLYVHISPGDFSLKRKKLHPIFDTAKTKTEILGMQATVRNLLRESNTADNLFRKKQLASDKCQYCYSEDEGDSTCHMLNNCQLTRQSAAARYARMYIFEQLQLATGDTLNGLLKKFWSEAETMTATIINPLSNGCHPQLRLDEDNPHLDKVIKACQFYVLIVTALRYQRDVQKPVVRQASLPGGVSRHHPRKDRKGPKGKGKFTSQRRTYEKNLCFQVSRNRGINDDLRYNGDVSFSRESKSSLVMSVLGPGIVPFLFTAPGEGTGRKLMKKVVVWSSHDFQPFTKTIQILCSYDDIRNNIQIHTIEAFPVREALKMATLAPVMYTGEGLDVTKYMECNHSVLPLTLVTLEHDLQVVIWGLENSKEMATLIIHPDTAPSKLYATPKAQMFSELCNADKSTFTSNGAQLGKSFPVENMSKWLRESLDMTLWSTMRMNDRDIAWPESAWNLAMVIYEWSQTGITRKTEAQAKLRHSDTLGADFVDRLTQTRGARPFQIQHPLEFLSLITHSRNPGQAMEAMEVAVSPIRGSSNASSRGASSRLSSTPSAPRSGMEEDGNVCSKIDALTGLVEELSSKLGVKKKLNKAHRATLDTTNEADESAEVTEVTEVPSSSYEYRGRHSEAFRSLQRALDNEARRKRERANTSKFEQANLQSYINPFGILGAVRDGPNGTIELSSDDHDISGTNYKVELGPGPSRKVTADKGKDDSCVMISSSDSSPTLKEGAAKTTMQLPEDDARHCISGDLRYTIDANRLSSTVRSLGNNIPPPDMSLSPLRRPAPEEPQPTTGRSQAQRRRTENMPKGGRPEDYERLIEAIRAQERGEENEDSSLVTSHTIYLRGDAEAGEFLGALNSTGNPAEVLSSILQQMQAEDTDAVYIPGMNEPGPRRSTTPPPSYADTMKRDSEIKKEPVSVPTSPATHQPDIVMATPSSKLRSSGPPGPPKTPEINKGKAKALAAKRSLAQDLADRRLSRTAYEEHLRDGHYDDCELDMKEDRDQANDYARQEVTMDEATEGMPPLEEPSNGTSNSEDVSIIGHVDSTHYMEEQAKAGNEKKKPTRKQKAKMGKNKKLDDTIHDEYRVVEDGFLVGHAKILKEARETTGAGNVQIYPKSPNDTMMSLDTTSEVEPEPEKVPKHTIIPKESDECTKEKIEAAGASEVYNYCDDVLLIHETSEERKELIDDDEDSAQTLAAIQRELDRYASTSSSSSGNATSKCVRLISFKTSYFPRRCPVQREGRGNQEGCLQVDAANHHSKVYQRPACRKLRSNPILITHLYDFSRAMALMICICYDRCNGIKESLPTVHTDIYRGEDRINQSEYGLERRLLTYKVTNVSRLLPEEERYQEGNNPKHLLKAMTENLKTHLLYVDRVIHGYHGYHGNSRQHQSQSQSQTHSQPQHHQQTPNLVVSDLVYMYMFASSLITSLSHNFILFLSSSTFLSDLAPADTPNRLKSERIPPLQSPAAGQAHQCGQFRMFIPMITCYA